MRRACLLIAAAFAVPGVPAQAQDGYDPGPPPPLPELIDDAIPDRTREDLEALEDRIDQSPAPGAYTQPAPPMPLSPALGYSAAQRDTWLEQCRRVYGRCPSFDTCADYLSRYEQAYIAYVEANR